MKVPFFVKNLPSGGMFIPKGVKNYDKDNYYIEIEPMTYGVMLDYTSAKDSASNPVSKLTVMIQYLIPDDLKEFPICDMYCIMSQVSLISGLDFLSEDVNLDQPYQLTNVICPSCGKRHDKIKFNLRDLDYTKFVMPIVDGEITWRDLYTFSNGDSYTFSMPTIQEFYNGLNSYLEMVNNVVDDQINVITKLVALSLAFNKFDTNVKTSSENFADKYRNMKTVFYGLSGRDAMIIEKIYCELIQPVVLFKKFCDCEGGSVLDVTYYITDILRLLISNSGRLTSKIYILPEEAKLKPEFHSLQFGGETILPSHRTIRERIQKDRAETDRGEKIPGESANGDIKKTESEYESK